MSEPTETGPFDYQLFGLHFRSALELPELQPFPAQAAAPDVVIRIDQSASDRAQVRIDGIADFQILDGREIRVSPKPGAADRNVRLFLLGSVMGMLLHQRGLLPLHANAIEIDGHAFAFMGPSASGKSTLAAWFHDRGHRIIADDVSVIRFDEEQRPHVCPGVPRLRLWKEALEATGRHSRHYDRSYAGDDDWEKYDVPIDSERLGGSAPLAAIYLLDQAQAFAIEPLSGTAAAEALFANTYRGWQVPGAGNSRLHWESCVKLVTGTPLFRLFRTWGLEDIDRQSEQILAHAGQMSAPS